MRNVKSKRKRVVLVALPVLLFAGVSNDPQRAAFIDRVAAPIANKLFECGMIP